MTTDVRRILQLLRTNGPMTRTQLADALGSYPEQASVALRRLKRQRYVEQSDSEGRWQLRGA